AGGLRTTGPCQNRSSLPPLARSTTLLARVEAQFPCQLLVSYMACLPRDEGAKRDGHAPLRPALGIACSEPDSDRCRLSLPSRCLDQLPGQFDVAPFGRERADGQPQHVAAFERGVRD